MMNGKLFCISGPSGVGKGTLVKELLRVDPTLALSVSCTTRAPRKGERDGVEYFFISREKFLETRDNGGFLEYDEHFGNFYGTPVDYVLDMMSNQKRSVLLEIDVVGALSVKERYADDPDVKVVTIFISPPTQAELESRLAHRGSEDAAQLGLRRERVQFELEMCAKYDYVVVNDDFNRALAELNDVIQQEKNK